MVNQKYKSTNVKSAEDFFLKIAAQQKDYIKPIKTTKDKKAILVSKKDKDLYDWALNG